MKKSLILFLMFTLVASAFAVSIYDVQYTENAGDGTYPSELEGQEVTVEGIVTAINWDGWNQSFFIQQEDVVEFGGVLIFASGDSLRSVGDKVSVTGTVVEYYGFTEIGSTETETTVELISEGNVVPMPTQITCSQLASEGYESVLVEVIGVNVLQEQDDYGQWLVQDDSGVCQIDDEFFYLNDVEPPIVIEADQFWGRITGIVDYSYNEFGLNPRTADDLQSEVSNEENFVNPVSLAQNYPNPFNIGTSNRDLGTVIDFNIEEAGNVEISVFNILGQKVKELTNKNYSAGNHNVTWYGNNTSGEKVSTGVYFYNISSGRHTSMKKMILVK